MSDWRFALRVEVEDDEEIVAPVIAAEFLERWLDDPWKRDEILDLVDDLTGVDSSNLYQLRPRDLYEFVMPRLERALLTGELVLVAPEAKPLPKIQIEKGEEPVAASAPPSERQEKKPEEKKRAWIDFRLIDRNGDPVPGKSWKVKLPDGTYVEGKTGKDGLVRLRDIPEGSCEITFPELAPDAWKVA